MLSWWEHRLRAVSCGTSQVPAPTRRIQVSFEAPQTPHKIKINSATTRIWAIKILNNRHQSCSSRLLTKLYSTTVHPVLAFGDPLFNSTPETDITSLGQTVRRAILLASHLPRGQIMISSTTTTKSLHETHSTKPASSNPSSTRSSSTENHRQTDPLITLN